MHAVRTLCILPILLTVGHVSIAHEAIESQISELTAVIARHPDDVRSLLRRAELYREHRDYGRAFADYNKAAKLEPFRERIAVGKASVQIEQGDLSGAKEQLDLYLARNSQDWKTRLLRAKLHSRLGEWALSEKDYTAAIQTKNVSDPDVFIERAKVVAKQGPGRVPSAIAGLDEGIAMLGPVVSLQLHALNLEVMLKEFAGAINRLDSMIASAPRHDLWLVRRGEILEEAGMASEAHLSYQRALAEISNLSPRQRNLAATHQLFSSAKLGVKGTETIAPVNAEPPIQTRLLSSPARPNQSIAVAGTRSIENAHSAEGSKGTPIFVTRGPYLALLTPNSISIRWRTNTNGDSVVHFGFDVEDLDQTASNPILTTDHEVQLTNLLPNRTYFYSIESNATALAGATPSHYFKTPMPTGHALGRPIRIWAMGDFGNGSAGQYNVRDRFYEYSADSVVDMFLPLGDNAYPSGTDSEYQTYYFEVYQELLQHTPSWPTLGNHDGVSADSETQSGVYYDIFTLPRSGEAGGLPSGTEAYYSFDYANIHLICLDSHDSDRSPDGAMMTWLEYDLMATTQDWIIAYWHHPPYTKGSHDSDLEFQLIEMRENALPILEAYGVDLVLSGHSHVYERSYFIAGHYGRSSTWNPSLYGLNLGNGRSDGDGQYQKQADKSARDGAVYVVAGSGGELVAGYGLNHPAHYYSALTRGSLIVDINGGELNAKFLNEDGVIDDYFTIQKPVTFSDDVDASTQIDAVDIQLVINVALGIPASFQTDLDGDNVTDAMDIQRIINAALEIQL
jgi:tetratricopeptide (TPR) repeat protein